MPPNHPLTEKRFVEADDFVNERYVTYSIRDSARHGSRTIGVSRSAAAVASRSMGNDVPASAAAPSGHSFILARASRTRDRSRANIST